MAKSTGAAHVAYNEISSKNFDSLYPSIVDAISKASYIVLDTEFTGHCKRITKNMEQRYDALAAVIKTHAIVSFGMTVLQKHTHPDQQHYTAHNFEFLTSNQDTFQVDPGNLKFLSENGLDFNRHFSIGLPYHAGTQPLVKNSPKDLRAMWRDIVWAVRVHQVPIVVHNGLLDLMYIYQSFFAQLPTQLSTFVADLVEMFPGGVYDTKYLAVHVQSEQKTFLAYLYCKYKRSHQQKIPVESRFIMQVQDPLQEGPVTEEGPITGKRPAATDTAGLSQGVKRRMRAKKIHDKKAPSIICHSYSNYGWCNAGKSCLSSHDLDLILDKDQGIQVELPEEPTLQDEPALHAPISTQRRDHAAHFDAYMTAFVFCHFAHEMGDGLKEHINKINLMRLQIPLRVTKSEFAKPSVAWSQVREWIANTQAQ
ncbi:ribonuclease H-like domain-containing protein [Spinellus fusiger]|nr:ribonuclease H-like domain-containing protein [Spinellus fusiger]